MRVGLPHARTLVVREKTASDSVKKPRKAAAKPPAKPPLATAAPPLPPPADEEDSISYFLSSRLPGPAEVFAEYIRGHWGGCEIRNHGTRDVQWLEDKTRSCNWALNASLAILRAVLISVKFRLGVTLPWPQIFEQCAHSTVSAAALINGKPIK